MSNKERNALLSLVVIVWTFWLYWGSLANGFVFDDNAFIVSNPALAASTPLKRFFLDPGTQSTDARLDSDLYRPLATLSESALFEMAGPNPRLFHFFSFAAHAATGCLLLFLVLSFDEALWLEALGAALLFVGHPVNVEAVAGAAHFSTLTSAFWVCVALLCSVQPAGRLWTIRALAAGLVACGFKESALMFPAFAWLLGWLRKSTNPGEPPRVCQSPSFLKGAAAVSAVFFAWRTFVLGHVARQSTLTGSRFTDVLLMIKAFGYDLKLLFWPHPLSYHYLFELPTGPLDRLVLLGAAAIAASLAAAWLLRRRYPEAAFAVAWFYAGLLPVSNAIPTNTLLNERSLYLPCIGFCILLPRLVGGFGRRFKPATANVALAAFLAAILIADAGLVRRRLADWENDGTLAFASLRTCPQWALLHNQLAIQAAQRNRFDDAIAEFTVSLAIDSGQLAVLKSKDLIPPTNRETLALWESWGRTLHDRIDFFPIWSNLGQVYLRRNEYEHAISALEQAAALSPGDPLTKKNLELARFAVAAQAPKRGAAALKAMSVEELFAAAMRAQRPQEKRLYRQEIAVRAPKTAYGFFCTGWLRPDAQTEEKLKDYSAAIALKPDLWPAYVLRGATYKSLNQLPQAVADFELAARKGQSLGQYNMGVLSLLGQGVPQDPRKAADWFEKAAAQDEPNSQVNLGVLYFQGTGVDKDYARAVKWFRKAAEQDNVPALDYLALIEEKGLGVPKDHARAVSWYRRAARLGDPMARKALEAFGEKL
jgi:TPR repeat protein